MYVTYSIVYLLFTMVHRKKKIEFVKANFWLNTENYINLKQI